MFSDIMINYAKYIDHTLLKPNATFKQLQSHVSEALKYGFNTVCVNPHLVPALNSLLFGSTVKPITVVGFPLGANHISTKVREAETAVNHGALELDYVVNLTWAAEGDWYKIASEAQRIKGSVPAHIIVKAIIETGLHTNSQISELTKAVTAGGVDFVKTCSGFNPGVATVENVDVIKNAGARNIKVSGGIKNAAQMSDFISMGVKRIGTSNSVKIMKQYFNEETPVEESEY